MLVLLVNSDNPLPPRWAVGVTSMQVWRIELICMTTNLAAVSLYNKISFLFIQSIIMMIIQQNILRILLYIFHMLL